MSCYAAYGLTIESEIGLPELPSADTESPDVVFRHGKVDPLPTSDEHNDRRRIRATPDRTRLTYDSIGSFLVEAGERVTIDLVTPKIEGNIAVRRLLENDMIALILHQRGQLVLHASAVGIDEKAVVFLGQRGAGKSTMATVFHQEGYDVFEDDTVCIRDESGVPTVLPGVPQLRLRPHTAETLKLDPTAQPTFTTKPEKVHIRLDTVPDPAPLARCYLLRRGGRAEFKELSLKDKFFNLRSQTFVRGLLADTGAAETHFEQCSKIIESVPFRELHYPEDLEELPSVIEMITDDLRASE